MNPRTGNMAMDEENENKEIERNEDVAETNSEVNDFVDNFLSSGDIQEIIESIKPEDMNIDDILKNPRFNDGMAKILDKLPASEREMFVSQAKNKITQVATNVSGQKKKQDEQGKKEKNSSENQSSSQGRSNSDMSLDDMLDRDKNKAKPQKGQARKMTPAQRAEFIRRMRGMKPSQNVAKTAEAGGRGLLKTQSKTIGKTAAKTIGKTAAKTVGKTAGKAVGKSLLKKIPGVSLGAGCFFAWKRIKDKDYLGAVGEVASGICGCIPGLGTAASVGIDTALSARDISRASKQAEMPAAVPDRTDVSGRKTPSNDLNRRILLEKRGIIQAPRNTPAVRPTQMNPQVLMALRGHSNS